MDTTRVSLEHAIPKAKGIEFCLLLSGLAAESNAARNNHVRTILGLKKESAKEEKPAKATVKTGAKTKEASAKPKRAKGETAAPKKSTRVAKDS